MCELRIDVINVFCKNLKIGIVCPFAKQVVNIAIAFAVTVKILPFELLLTKVVKPMAIALPN